MYIVVYKLCLTLWDPMDCSMPSFPVLHYHLKLAQTHIHWIGDANQPAHPLSPPSPSALSPSQYQGLIQWVRSSFTSGGQSIVYLDPQDTFIRQLEVGRPVSPITPHPLTLAPGNPHCRLCFYPWGFLRFHIQVISYSVGVISLANLTLCLIAIPQHLHCVLVKGLSQWSCLLSKQTILFPFPSR